MKLTAQAGSAPKFCADTAIKVPAIEKAVENFILTMILLY